MAGITLTQAETNLAAWLTASEKTAQGKSYTIGGRSLSRSDASEIRDMINFWQGHVTRLSSGGRGGRRMRGGTPT